MPKRAQSFKRVDSLTQITKKRQTVVYDAKTIENLEEIDEEDEDIESKLAGLTKKENL